jgi:hypothetical protein
LARAKLGATAVAAVVLCFLPLAASASPQAVTAAPGTPVPFAEVGNVAIADRALIAAR